MATVQQDVLIIPQGTTWAVRWPIQDVDGGPIDTTGWTVRSQVRRRHTDPQVLHEWSTEAGNANVFDSFVELRVEPLVSSEWNWGTSPVVFDVELTTLNNEIIRISQGTIQLKLEVTK